MILECIGKEIGVASDELEKIVKSANHRYKVFSIPKRTTGIRIVHQPSKELKFLQRWLIRNVFTFLPIHRAAYAYRKNRGIVDAARVHVRNNFLLKADFANFFPSLRQEDVKALLKVNVQNDVISLDDHDIEVVSSIVCKDRKLTIGAPSSPGLSNAILYEFDCRLTRICEESDVEYSRYADDLYFSTNRPGQLTLIFVALRRTLSEQARPKLWINERKTVFTSRKRHRRVAGLTLTSDRKISVGRANKRRIQTLVYLYGKNELSDEEISYLRGYLAFINSVEPEFIQRLRNRYGDEVVEQAIGSGLISRKKSIATRFF